MFVHLPSPNSRADIILFSLVSKARPEILSEKVQQERKPLENDVNVANAPVAAGIVEVRRVSVQDQ